MARILQTDERLRTVAVANRTRILVVCDESDTECELGKALDEIRRRLGGRRAVETVFRDGSSLSDPLEWKKLSEEMSSADIVLFTVTMPAIMPAEILNAVRRCRSCFEDRSVSFGLLVSQGCEEDTQVKLARRFLRLNAELHHGKFIDAVLPTPQSEAEIRQCNQQPRLVIRFNPGGGRPAFPLAAAA